MLGSFWERTQTWFGRVISSSTLIHNPSPPFKFFSTLSIKKNMNHETYSTKIKTWEHYSLSVSMLGSFTRKTTDLLQLWRDRDYHSQCQDNMKQLLIFSEGGGVSWEKKQIFWERCRSSGAGADLLCADGEVQLFWGRCTFQIFWGRCTVQIFWGRCIVQIFWGRCTVQIFWGRCTMQVFWGRYRSYGRFWGRCRSSEGGADLKEVQSSKRGADLLEEVQIFWGRCRSSEGDAIF